MLYAICNYFILGVLNHRHVTENQRAKRDFLCFN
jgi:hypothetical protein